MDREILMLLLTKAHNVTYTRREVSGGVVVAEEEYFFALTADDGDYDSEPQDPERVTIQ